jgi:hypothetical protein
MDSLIWAVCRWYPESRRPLQHGQRFGVADPNPQQSGKQDPDPNPHQSEKQDPDPDPHQGEKQDPDLDPHQSEKVEALEGHFRTL